jgi:hypothetical protein
MTHHRISRLVLLLGLLLGLPLISQATTPSTDPQDAFFAHLSSLRGLAFVGRVTVGNEGDRSFSDHTLVMHVWKQEGDTLYIPFHVGEDRSRTWILRKTGSGLSLKHDHRHKDGSFDISTMYGGHTVDAGWGNAQTFPADAYSKELFIRTEMPQSVSNSWHMYIYPGKTFTYRLTREGREFRVDFDLSKPISLPPLPWGHKD